MLQGRPPDVLQECGVLRGKGQWISIFEKADTGNNLDPWLCGYLGMRSGKGDPEKLHSMGSGCQVVRGCEGGSEANARACIFCPALGNAATPGWGQQGGQG